MAREMSYSSFSEILKLAPDALCFRGSFKSPLTKNLSITNVTEHIVIYQLKSNVPNSYSVDAGLGIVLPYETLNVDIVLKPFKYQENERYKHKFLIKAIVTNNFPSDLPSYWYGLNPDELLHAKLRVNFQYSTEIKIIDTSKNKLDNPKLISGPRGIKYNEADDFEYLQSKVVQMVVEETRLHHSNRKLLKKSRKLRIKLAESFELSDELAKFYLGIFMLIIFFAMWLDLVATIRR